MLKYYLWLVLAGGMALSAQEDPVMTQLLPDATLNRPWQLLYGPDGKLWVTERGGRISRVDPATGEREVLFSIPGVTQTSGQDGLLGLALHPAWGQGQGKDYVYVAFASNTAQGRRQRIRRYTYDISGNSPTLIDPTPVLDGLPVSNDHNSGRLRIGPDTLLYYSIGDQGANQFGNKCTPIVSQVLPTQAEVDQGDWTHYPGKILRMTLTGAIPPDNPVLNGVRSHVYTYGHRNAQGLWFGANGRLYANEHGPKSDDEVNLIEAGQNYGWPHTAGYRDDLGYAYCNWSSHPNCAGVSYSDYTCPPEVSPEAETDWSHPDFAPPLFTFFTVPNDHNFRDTTCTAFYICWPSIAPSAMVAYTGFSNPLAGWDNSLLNVSLKRGKVYRLALNAAGTEVVGDTVELWYTQNRYRDLAVAPDGRTFYLLTDVGGQTTDPDGRNTGTLLNPGTILKVTYPGATTVTAPAVPLSLWVQQDPTGTAAVLHFGGEGATQAKTITLRDLHGRHLGQVQSAAPRLSLPLEGLAPGWYLVQVTAPGGSLVRKVMVR